MKVKTGNPALRQKLQGMMDAKSIPRSDVDQLMQNPAELKSLLNAGGTQFDQDIRQALEQVIGGATEQKASPQPSGAFAKSGAQSAFSLQVDQTAKTRASGDGDGSPADGGWWDHCKADLGTALYPQETAKAATVGTEKLSGEDISQMLRQVGEQPPSKWNTDGGFVSKQDIDLLQKGMDTAHQAAMKTIRSVR